MTSAPGGTNGVSPEAPTTPDPDRHGRFGAWLLAAEFRAGHPPRETYPWWKVMCLTGVDYFSTLGYQPGIAFLAAGLLSPVATLVLVLVTLGVALPVYRFVAVRSPNGQGSLRMLEDLLPRWRGKALVLVLLGFATTDFVITMTLSAADAADHITHNPFTPPALQHPLLLTLLLLALLGAIFLRGFGEAIGLAVPVVVLYLALNGVVLAASLAELGSGPARVHDWWQALSAQHTGPFEMLLVAGLLFPKLALGLSGFETGVAVMPLVRGTFAETPSSPRGRIRNTRLLLLTSASIMSVYLIASSIVTTLLIPPEEFASGGRANGRALAFLAHGLLGSGFGTLYDASTIAILWFAGASAMAGLLNLVPRYLPPYGMAPEWARAIRPLTLVFTAIAIVVTLIFDADVDAQAGAYATGVLVLMTSAALAVALANRHARWGLAYWGMLVVFAYTTTANMIERPEGLRIAAVFIAAIVGASVVSRSLRSTELRIGRVRLDPAGERFVDEDAAPGVRLIAHRPDKRTVAEYERKEEQARVDHGLPADVPVLFLEVDHGDASIFSSDLDVCGVRVGRHRVLRCTSPAIPNAIAALLLHIGSRTGRIPDAYFGWTEGSPAIWVLRFLVLGEGDTAPVTREVLRRAVPDPPSRPRIHVG